MQDIMIMASLVVFLNVTLLAILVPGGPIENRNFSALKGEKGSRKISAFASISSSEQDQS